MNKDQDNVILPRSGKVLPILKIVRESTQDIVSKTTKTYSVRESFSMPAPVLNDFKALCREHNLEMSPVVAELIKAFTKDLRA